MPFSNRKAQLEVERVDNASGADHRAHHKQRQGQGFYTKHDSKEEVEFRQAVHEGSKVEECC